MECKNCEELQKEKKCLKEEIDKLITHYNMKIKKLEKYKKKGCV